LARNHRGGEREEDINIIDVLSSLAHMKYWLHLVNGICTPVLYGKRKKKKNILYAYERQLLGHEGRRRLETKKNYEPMLPSQTHMYLLTKKKK
jgi:hypothetical protein